MHLHPFPAAATRQGIRMMCMVHGQARKVCRRTLPLVPVVLAFRFFGLGRGAFGFLASLGFRTGKTSEKGVFHSGDYTAHCWAVLRSGASRHSC